MAQNTIDEASNPGLPPTWRVQRRDHDRQHARGRGASRRHVALLVLMMACSHPPGSASSTTATAASTPHRVLGDNSILHDPWSAPVEPFPIVGNIYS